MLGVKSSYATGFAQWPGMSEYPGLWTGLVGAWAPFLGATGNKVLDWSGNGNTGTYTGTPDWGAGFYGPQVRCDDDQYITFANKATDYITDKFTVVWIGTPVQLEALIRQFFVGQYEPDGADYDWGLYINANFTVNIFTRNAGGTAKWAQSTSSLSVGTKTCIAGTYDGTTIRIYFDGVEQDTEPQTGNVQGSHSFKLGHLYNTTRYCDIKTDFLGVYNRALSASEIALLCQLRKRLVA